MHGPSSLIYHLFYFVLCLNSILMTCRTRRHDVAVGGAEFKSFDSTKMAFQIV